MQASKITKIWQPSSSVKRAQLQSIATSIGAPLSGTKAQLLTGIQDLLGKRDTQCEVNSIHKKQHDSGLQNYRVLSIDMGIRNLAFAFLTCQTSGHVNSNDSSNSQETNFTKPELRHWRRIELFNVEKTFRPTESTQKALAQLETEPDISAAILDESFEPPVLAKHAYTFSKYCASLQPTHILIERQRFRTGGHAAVLEWSLRVGMLESMLHSAFYTLKHEGLLPHTTVNTILPIRVNKYWFDQHQELLGQASADGTIEGTSGKQTKLAKITIVDQLLKSATNTSDAENHALFSVHPEVRALADAFMAKVHNRSVSKKKDKVKTRGEPLEKLDDVADSLLQGLAWLRWQENCEKLLTTPSTLDVS